MKIQLDLYDYYKSRKDGLNPVNPRAFYVLLRILLACDVVHDFIKPRGPAGEALWIKYLAPPNGSSHLTKQEVKEKFEEYKEHFLKVNAERIIKDCREVAENELLAVLHKLTLKKTGDYSLTQQIMNLFTSEEIAKKTTDRIHVLLGLTEQNIQDAMLRSRPCDDFNVLDLIRALDIVKSSGKSHDYSTKYNITIDATSDKTNLTPFFSELMNRAYKKRNSCSESNEINIVNSYATKYDSSNDDALTKIFTSLGLSRGDYDSSDLDFDIKCGDLSVFNGSLKKEDGKVKLTINSYFKEKLSPSMKRGSDSVESVNGITKDMLISYKSLSAPPGEFFNLTIFKTMGDFLQIMTHLHLSQKFKNDINVFITFDILCAKIAGILDKNVFYEKKFTADADKISGGLYTFFTETARDERISALSLMDMSAAPRGPESMRWLVDDAEMSDWLPPMYNFVSPDGNSGGAKRSRTRFGKKPKVKRLKNKALMTKLKSVGIKITKKQGKRLVYLSRPELIKRATAFKNLQLRAKKLKVRIMYKNKKGKYVYKTAKRLMNDIKRQISKLKKSAKKPVKKQMKKPVKKSNVKQMKQRFG
tara:strand:+ start:13698 stop:15461 length:1764 start_codon:yes stop_codon:yes gene_type:complete